MKYNYIHLNLEFFKNNFFSISSFNPIIKLSYLTVKISYSDKEILNASFNSLSYKSKKLDNHYYNYQILFDNVDFNKNFIIFRIKIDSEKEKINPIFITRTFLIKEI